MRTTMKTLVDALNIGNVPAYKTIVSHHIQCTRSTFQISLEPESASASASASFAYSIFAVVDKCNVETHGVSWSNIVHPDHDVKRMSFQIHEEVKDTKEFCYSTEISIVVNEKENTLILCGVGCAGHYGEKIWNSGYDAILNGIENVIASRTGDSDSIEHSILCPDCLVNSIRNSFAPTMWHLDYV